MEDDLILSGRVFAAVVPPAEVVAALVMRLEPLSLPGRPVPPANWHTTLRFVGKVQAVAYERWLAEMNTAALPAPFPIAVTNLGAFPRPARATVLWAAVEGETLADLAAVVDEAAGGAGLGREERPFRPHLTIARVRPPADVRSLIDDDDEWRMTFPVKEFHVMAAVGSRYRVYETFSL